MPIQYIKERDEINFNEQNILIYFTAKWCGPCQTISPEFEKISNIKSLQHISFYKVDVNDSESLTKEFNIQSMPTFIFIKNTKIIDTLVGPNNTILVDQIKKNFL